MKQVLAFSGSSSSASINHKLVRHAASCISKMPVTLIDIRDYPMPLYSIDLEQQSGFPENARKLHSLFANQAGFVIACPEHNGSMPVIFKNLIDWLSRMEGKIFREKPVLLLSTSPGAGGGATNLKNLSVLVPWWGGKVTGTMSAGGFNDVFDAAAGQFKDSKLSAELVNAVSDFEAAVLAESESSPAT